MNKLVEKIKALYEEKRDRHGFSGEYRGGWDSCIERVLDIIQAEFYQKDACEGLWLIADPYWRSTDVVVISGILHYSNKRNNFIPVSQYKGKWISLSSIVPTKDGER